MENWASDFVKTNGIKLHYLRSGGNKPPLVLCHGFSDNGLCWKRVALILEEDYDLIMVDARGHGLSDAPESGYTTEDHVADMAGLIETLGLKGCAIMGHSMGAATSAGVASRHEGLVSCAVLEDPPWRTIPLEFTDPTRREARRKELTGHKSRTPGQIKEWCRKEHPTWNEIDLDCLVEARQQFNLQAMNVLGQQFEWRNTSRSIQCPTLIIAADTSKGAIVDEQAAREIVSKSSNIEVVRFENAGHNIRREAFEPYVATVQKFLLEHYKK